MSDPAPVTTTTSEQPTKKKKRIFMWFFLAVQAIFIIWIVAGIGGADTGDCGSLDQESCEAAAAVGTGLGVIMIIGLWMVVDFLLAVGYVIYRLARRP